MTSHAIPIRQIVARAFRAASVWLPLAAGGILAWTAPASSPAMWFGVAVAAAGVARALWLMTAGREQLVLPLVASARRLRDRAEHERLRQLQRKLRRDGDPRSGELLRKLRSLYDRLSELRSKWQGGSATPQPANWRAELFDSVQDVYAAVYRSLEQSYELFTAGSAVADADERARLIGHRQSLLDEIAATLTALERSLDQMQSATALAQRSDHDLSQLRRELEEGLAVARNVQRRLAELDQQGRPREFRSME